jgi:hypothetical protein
VAKEPGLSSKEEELMPKYIQFIYDKKPDIQQKKFETLTDLFEMGF